MSPNSEDNTVYVLRSAAKKLKIRVTKNSIREFLLTHPHYPTLKSICDALKEWHVDHYPLRLDPAEIKELQVPFIAHLNVSGGQLAFVEKIHDSHVFYRARKGKTPKELFETFAGKLSGAVILAEPDHHSGEPEYRSKRQKEVLNEILLPLEIIGTLLLLFFNFFMNSESSILQSQTIGWGLAMTKLAGVTACIFLLLKELKIANRLTQKICSFSTKIDCDTVLSSSTSRLFGWTTWADAGLIYFTGTLFYLSGSTGDTSLSVLALISTFSLLYSLFSIWYQSVKLKKWCPICLAVQFVLITEFVLLLPLLKKVVFAWIDMLRLVISFFVPGIIWLVLKAYYNKSEELEQEHSSNLKIKRDSSIFRFLLTQNGHTEFPKTGTALELGNTDAPIILTAFLSLYCSPCAKAFEQLKSVITNCPEVKVNVIFSVHHNEETQKLITVLYYIYQSQGHKACLNFLDKWYLMKKISRKTLYNPVILPKNFNIAARVGIENKQLFEKYHIEGTPTIYVNGYKFPNQSAYTDLKYYIDDLKLITMESKRQEDDIN